MSLDLKNGVIAPVITALVLGIGTKAYLHLEEKMDKLNLVIEKHPELLETLEDLHNVKDEMQKEYKVFRVKTEYRLNEIESQDGVNLKPIENRLLKDSVNIKRIESRLNYLKSLHL